MNVHISKTGNDNTIGEIRLLENVSAVKRNNAAAAHREIFPRKAAVVKNPCVFKQSVQKPSPCLFYAVAYFDRNARFCQLF